MLLAPSFLDFSQDFLCVLCLLSSTRSGKGNSPQGRRELYGWALSIICGEYLVAALPRCEGVNELKMFHRAAPRLGQGGVAAPAIKMMRSLLSQAQTEWFVQVTD
jgi:hypothetical protein